MEDQEAVAATGVWAPVPAQEGAGKAETATMESEGWRQQDWRTSWGEWAVRAERPVRA